MGSANAISVVSKIGNTNLYFDRTRCAYFSTNVLEKRLIHLSSPPIQLRFKEQDRVRTLSLGKSQFGRRAILNVKANGKPHRHPPPRNYS